MGLSLQGRDLGGSFKTVVAKVYPEEMNAAIAQAIIRFVQVTFDVGSSTDPLPVDMAALLSYDFVSKAVVQHDCNWTLYRIQQPQYALPRAKTFLQYPQRKKEEAQTGRKSEERSSDRESQKREDQKGESQKGEDAGAPEGVAPLKRICKDAFRVAGAVQVTYRADMLRGQGADFLRGAGAALRMS
eukprot:s470_g10.t1